MNNSAESGAACGLCTQPATGFADINGRRYCHGDDDFAPTCYERAQWTIARAHHPDCPVNYFTDRPERCRCMFMAMLDRRSATPPEVDSTS